MTMQMHSLYAKQLGLWRYFLLILFLIVTWLFMPIPVSAAPFSSGSTGADGAFSPATNTVLTLPPDGKFNFTTVNIPTGVTVTFTPNAANTPVTILTSGNVVIDGTININGQDGASVNSGTMVIPIGSGGTGGPGGFGGGAGGIAKAWNGGVQLAPGHGLGPGASATIIANSGCGASFSTQPPGGCSGVTYGNILLMPLIGGSGGSGGPASTSSGTSCTNGCNGGGGGGGGGAILIASSGTITVNGTIMAIGGNGGNGFSPGGPGSGGAIRLIANTIGGSGIISAEGGGPNSQTYPGGAGRIRVETNVLNFSGTVNPAVTVSTPGLVNFSLTPSLSITAIAGVSVPAGSTGLYSSPDVTLPSSTSNPVTVNLAASNIPVGTVIKLIISPRNVNSNISVPISSTPLSGTDANSTATASITLNTTMVSIIRAETTFAVQMASNDFPKFAEGEKVENVRVAAAVGGLSEVFLITESGKEVRWR